MIRWILLTIIFVSQVSFATGVTSSDIPLTEVTAPTKSAVDAMVATAESESKALKALKETEIPVNLEPVKKGGGSDSPWMRMLGGLAIVGILAAGSWVFVRRAKTANRTSSLAPEIKVLAQHYLGPKKSLAIIRVAGESILLGVTENNISMIKSLSLLDEDIPETVPGTFSSVFSPGTDFDESKQKMAVTASKASSSEENDDFSISGIKDVVTNRLKNMRNFQ